MNFPSYFCDGMSFTEKAVFKIETLAVVPASSMHTLQQCGEVGSNLQRLCYLGLVLSYSFSHQEQEE